MGIEWHTLLKGLDTYEQTVHIAALIQGYTEKNIWSERRSSVADERVGGFVFTAGDNAIFFLGMRDQIITSLEAQDFDNIATKSFDQEVKHCTVLCKISPYRWKFFKRLIDDRILDRIQIKHKKSHLEFEATGYLYFSSSGIVHGFILRMTNKLFWQPKRSRR
ncbi:MAG: hypothetical protein H6684_12565 [Deltaproteobacteria bacterium]|nr:hypothetical protein [Deltaproteobacteria bacterium]